MFKFEKTSATECVELTPVERVVEFTPGGVDAENISRILSLSVDGRVNNTTAFDGYVEVDGRANFKLTYLDRDGMPRGVDYNADFTVRLEGDVTGGDSVSADVSVAEADASVGVSLTLSAVISVSAVAVRRVEEDTLSDADDCYKTMKTIVVPSFIAAKSAMFPVSDETDAGEVGSVLSIDGGSIVKEATAGENSVTVAVTTRALVAYTEDGELKTAEFVIEDSEEIAVEGAAAGDIVIARAALTGGRIVLDGVTGANVLRFEGDVVLKIQVFRKKETEVVDDMFMLTNEITLTRTEKHYRCYERENFYTEKISGTVQVEGAVKMVAVPASRCYIAKVEADGGALVEGLLTADLVYQDEDGLNSVRAEIPYSVTLGDGYTGGVAASAAVVGITAVLRKNGEIEVSAEVAFSVMESVETDVEFISAVEVGEEKEVNTSGLSVYIASEGDEMWDVCKALTATPEAITEQNPTMAIPLSEGEKIIFFRTLSLS